jgi:hypothetical protein
MSLSTFLDELGGNVNAGIRGYATGLTGGLVRYPQAAVNKFFNGGTYEENLAGIRESEAQAASEHPVAYYGSNVVGAVQPAGLAMKVLGGGTKAALAANTAMGALNGATANAGSEGTTAMDTAVGAGMGLAGGTLGALGGKAVNSMASRVAKNALYTKLIQNPGWKSDAYEYVSNLLGRKAKYEDVVKFAKSEAEGMVSGAGPTVGGPVPGPKASIAELAGNTVKKAFTGVVPAAATGAAGGAASSLVTGQDPLEAMKTGALSAVAISKMKAAQGLTNSAMAFGGRVLANNPRIAALSGAPGAAGLVSPVILGTTTQAPEADLAQFKANPRKVSGVVTSEPDNELSQYEVRPSAPATSSPSDELEQYRVK